MPQELYVIQIIVNFLAIVLGPVTAVCITLWIQARGAKKTAKQQLFLTLMAERKSLLISPQVARTLNTIDVVFTDSPQVVQLWHKYYNMLAQQPSEERLHTWLELLSAMAAELGYPRLKQTDLDKFYIPQGHVDQMQFEREVQGELLRVLKNTERLVVEQRKPLSTS